MRPGRLPQPRPVRPPGEEARHPRRARAGDGLPLPGRGRGARGARQEGAVLQVGGHPAGAAPVRRLGRGVSQPPRLGDQLLIPQGVRFDQSAQRVPEQVRVLAVFEAEGHLFQVGRQVLLADLVVSANDGAVQDAPHAFDGVRVNLPDDPFLLPVVDRRVQRALVFDALVGFPIVGEDGISVLVYVLVNEAVQGLAGAVLDDAETDAAAALHRADDEGLVAGEAAPLAGMLSADPRFVHFHNGVQKRLVLVLHRSSDAVRQVPRRLVGDAEHALELVGADAPLGLADHVDSEEPFPQRQVRVVKDGPDADGELIAAAVAFELAAFLNAGNRRAFATGAGDALRPAQLFQVLMALVFATEALNQSRKVKVLSGYGRLQ